MHAGVTYFAKSNAHKIQVNTIYVKQTVHNRNEVVTDIFCKVCDILLLYFSIFTMDVLNRLFIHTSSLVEYLGTIPGCPSPLRDTDKPGYVEFNALWINCAVSVSFTTC